MRKIFLYGGIIIIGMCLGTQIPVAVGKEIPLLLTAAASITGVLFVSVGLVMPRDLPTLNDFIKFIENLNPKARKDNNEEEDVMDEINMRLG